MKVPITDRESGFTFAEVIVVLVVGAVLVSISIGGFGDVTSRFSVRGARQDFAALVARARVHAIERSVMTRVRIDEAADSVWIETAADRVAVLDLRESRGVDVETSQYGIVTLCMSPRGFADVTCNSFGSYTVALEFSQGGESANLMILPLGQLQW